MKFPKRLLVLGLVVAVPMALVFLVWARHREAVVRYQNQLLAAGEKLKLEEVLPKPTLPEQNGASFFWRALGPWARGATNLLDRNPPAAMHVIGPGKAVVGWAQPDIRGEGTNTWSEVESAIAAEREHLEFVRKAAEYPVLDFHLDYNQGFALLLPHLAPLKRAEQRLTTALLCDLHRGDAASASTNLEVMLALVKATAHEPLGISQLVRMAMAQICVTATWELLQAPGLQESELEAIQHAWAELDFIQPAEDSLALERAMSQRTLQRMRSSRAQFRQVMGGGGGPGNPVYSFGQAGDSFVQGIAAGAREAEWRWFLSYPDQLRALQAYQVLLDGFRQVQSGQAFGVVSQSQQGRLAELGLHPTNEDRIQMDAELRSLFSDAAESLHGVLNRVYLAETARELTTTALALKRYQLRHGQYPAELSALVPELLPMLPRDPADGQTLRYRWQPDGTFLLYSLGEDGVDNGGDGSPARRADSLGWQRGRDLVWPSPATAAELASWQRNQALKHSR